MAVIRLKYGMIHIKCLHPTVQEELNMKKKYVFALSVIMLFLCMMIGYKIYLNTIDTRYAVHFAEVFMNYDIQEIDEYFSDDTIFVCNGVQKTYKEIRNNVQLACNEKKYEFNTGSSYGYGNDKFTNKIQNINVLLHGKYNGENFGDCNISMKIKKEGLFLFSVDSVECDDKIFEYLFFGDITDNL